MFILISDGCGYNQFLAGDYYEAGKAREVVASVSVVDSVNRRAEGQVRLDPDGLRVVGPGAADEDRFPVGLGVTPGPGRRRVAAYGEMNPRNNNADSHAHPG